MWKKIPDSFVLGVVSGMITLSLFYIVIAYIRLLVVNYYGDPYLFRAPKVQLLSVFMNVLLFRIAMISMDKEKFGKGILLATVSATLIYFFFYFKYHQSLIGS